MRALTNSTLTLVATGPAPVPIAWRRYALPEEWPTWAPQLRRVETDAALLTAGMTGRVIGPLGVSAGFEVLDVDAAERRWTWRVRRGPLVIELEHGVEQDPEGPGSCTWLTLRGPLPVIVGYAPVARLALGRLVA